MFPTCKGLFDASSSDDNSFYGFSKEELTMASNRKVVGTYQHQQHFLLSQALSSQVQVLHAHPTYKKQQVLVLPKSSHFIRNKI